MSVRAMGRHYSGPPLMRPPLGNGKSGRIRGVAAGEGELQIKYHNFGYMFFCNCFVCIRTTKSEISGNLYKGMLRKKI